jgi:2-succinyl-5-enolpyruvyl-6-hydroxy-3-cyclohexene-1-carboxylate synthase
MTDPADVQASFAATLVDEWARSGVTDAVVAPGSRSTPLILALAAEARIRMHVVLDERSGGFFALGLGLAHGRPAVVVTTSGTAASELHPAVIEADQAGVPLLAVTADRPVELHQVGAPQTIEQDGLFSGSARWTASPGVADAAGAGTWRSLASRSVAETTDNPAGPGPVHLNLAFREPLLGEGSSIPDGRAGGKSWHEVAVGLRTPPDDLVAELATLAGRRGLIVAGAGTGGPVDALAAALGWPVLADPLSGARIPGPLTVAAADSLLKIPEVAAWRPEVVLRLGQPWASRVLSTWLGDLSPDVDQILVDPYGRWSDPGRRVRRAVRCSVASLSRAVVAAVAGLPEPAATGAEPAAQEAGKAGASGAHPAGAHDHETGVQKAGGQKAGGQDHPAGAHDHDDDPAHERLAHTHEPAPARPSLLRPAAPAVAVVVPTGYLTEWAGQWMQAESAAQAAIDDVIASHAELTEPGLARALVAAAPAGSRLFVSSSMPVRDVEWYGRPRTGLSVVANRGANGIDGIISTALGLAAAGPVTALMGDLAFLYDAGALLWARERPVDCVLVVVDNDGGGIFNFLPQASGVPPDQFQRFWGTPHPRLDLSQIAAAYRIPVDRVSATGEVEEALAGAGVRVVYARTEREANVAVHHEIDAAVAKAVTAATSRG